MHLHSSTSLAMGLLQPQWWSRTMPMPRCVTFANNTGAVDRTTMTPSNAWTALALPCRADSTASAIACARHGAGFGSVSVDAYRALGYGVAGADQKCRSGRSPFRRATHHCSAEKRIVIELEDLPFGVLHGLLAKGEAYVAELAAARANGKQAGHRATQPW